MEMTLCSTPSCSLTITNKIETSFNPFHLVFSTRNLLSYQKRKIYYQVDFLDKLRQCAHTLGHIRILGIGLELASN